MQNADAVAFLTATYNTLIRQRDLSPNNPEVNSCLTKLVHTLRSWQSKGFGFNLPDHPKLSDIASELPRLCAEAECEMEKWWCRHILSSACPAAQAIEAFWYIDDYEALCSTELKLLDQKPSGKFAFLGSGALPLTAIILAQRHPDICITCIDRDSNACELAEKLFKILNIESQIKIKSINAEDYCPDSNETIVCASLLRAPKIFQHLQKNYIKKIIVRDAEGPYRFLYHPALLPKSGYIQQSKSEICIEHINTSRYFKIDDKPNNKILLSN